LRLRQEAIPGGVHTCKKMGMDLARVKRGGVEGWFIDSATRAERGRGISKSVLGSFPWEHGTGDDFGDSGLADDPGSERGGRILVRSCVEFRVRSWRDERRGGKKGVV